MKWPWQRPIVEHRSSLTDQVVTAILQSASGGGARPALATAAVETCATLYASALSACELTGPPSVTRAFHADWRASVASALIRRGQCVFVIGASPLDGLTLSPASSFDIYGGADPPWLYRVERAGPSSTRWDTYSGDSILHLHWLTDHARPWAGVSPLQTGVRFRQSRGVGRKTAGRGSERAGRELFANRAIRTRARCQPCQCRRR